MNGYVKNKNTDALDVLLMIFPFLDLFSAYSFFNVGDFSVTLSVITATLIMILFVLRFLFGKIKITYKSIFLFFTFVINLFISAISNFAININFKSIFLYLFFAVYYLLIFNYKNKTFNTLKTIKNYTLLITLLGLFGIFQFIAQFTPIGYINLTIDGFMRPGFNTTNLVYIGNFSFYRAHSIYLEPSIFSITESIGLILIFLLFKIKYISKKTFILNSTINLIALFLTIAGTGLLLLLTFTFYYLYTSRKSKGLNALKPIFFMLLLFIILTVIACFSNIGRELFVNRVFEVFKPGYSGFVRFVLPYYLLILSIFKNPFGCGPSNTQIIYDMTNLNMPAFNNIIADVNSSYGKIGVELGIIGIVLYIYLCFVLIKKSKNEFSKTMAFIFVIMGFLSGNLLDFNSLVLLSFSIALNDYVPVVKVNATFD